MCTLTNTVHSFIRVYRHIDCDIVVFFCEFVKFLFKRFGINAAQSTYGYIIEMIGIPFNMYCLKLT